MQLAITNLSAVKSLELHYLELSIKPGATVTLDCAQSELSKMVDLQQAVADGRASYQTVPSTIETASGILMAGIPIATQLVSPQEFGGPMLLSARAGFEIPLPTFAATPAAGGGYFALPEVDEPGTFWLEISGNPQALTVRYVDSRHIDNRSLPASSAFGTLLYGVLDVTVRVGSYEVRITGVVSGTTLSGDIRTTVRQVTEEHTCLVNTASPPTWQPGSYYSSYGNDANDGLSLAAPKRTLPRPGNGGFYYLERGSIFSGVNDHIADEAQEFTVLHVGCGHWILGNQFAVLTGWVAAGAAWTASFPNAVVGIDSLTGTSQALENGMPMKQAASLAACQATVGSYYTPTTITPTPAPIVMYIHPSDGGDPNSNGKVYEIAAYETFLAGCGSSHFEGVIGRGSTCPTGSLISRAKHNDGTDYPILRHFFAFGGTYHNVYWSGGLLEHGATMCTQPQGGASSNFVWHRHLVGEVPQTVHTNDIAILSDPNVSVSSNESAWLWHGDSPMGAQVHDKMYIAHCAGDGLFQSGVSGTVTLRDALFERFKSTATQLFYGVQGWIIERLRHYQLTAAYWPGPALMRSSTSNLAISNSLVVTGFGNSSAGNTFDGYFTPDGGPNPTISTVTLADSTIINLNSAATRSVAWYQGSTGAGNTLLHWSINRTIFSGWNKSFVFGGSATAAQVRLSSDHNTFSPGVSTWWMADSIDMGFVSYKEGWYGTWAASDANSFAGVSTFSGTTGRYPSYAQTTTNPGGYTEAFIDPGEYYGVMLIRAFETAGRLPA